MPRKAQGSNSPWPISDAMIPATVAVAAAAGREVLASRVTPRIVSLGQRSPEMLADMRQALAAGSADDEEDEITAASNADASK